MKLFRFIVRRMALLGLTLLLVSVLIFALTQILPGDVAVMMLGQQATPEDLATLRERLGLNRPAHVQYLAWVTGILRGDWGESLRLGVPVQGVVMARFTNSLQLAVMAFALSVPLAIALGVVAGLREGRVLDRAISLACLFAVSLPEFVTGSVLILVFSVWLGVFPPSSTPGASTGILEQARNLFLPSVCLVLVMLAHSARMTRTSLIEVMSSNYVRTAILKGLRQREVVIHHALRNALAPTVTVIAMNIGWLIGGLVVVESLFAYPGLGRLLVFAISNRDIPVIQAASLVVAATYAGANLAADVLYGVLDPRVRYD